MDEPIQGLELLRGQKGKLIVTALGVLTSGPRSREDLYKKIKSLPEFDLLSLAPGLVVEDREGKLYSTQDGYQLYKALEKMGRSYKSNRATSELSSITRSSASQL